MGEPAMGSASGGSDSSEAPTESPLEIPEGCGNGVLEAGEDCDLGFANAEDGACTPVCTMPRCGDGFLAPGEDCDQGEANGGEQCTEACRIASRLTWSQIISGPAHELDRGLLVTPMSDGGVVMVSEQRRDPVDLVLDRYAADGTHRWTRTLPGDLHRHGVGADIESTDDDGVLLAHLAEERDVGDTERVELVNLDGDGEPRWTYELPSSVDGTPVRGGVAQTGAEIVLTVLLLGDSDQVTTRIVRLDAEGTVLGTHDVEQNIVRTVPGPEGGFYAYGSDLLMAFDRDDALRWSQSLPQINSAELAVDSQGRVAASFLDPDGVHELRLFDPEGELVWSAITGVFIRSVATGPGDVFAVGGTLEAGPAELSINTKIGVELIDSDGQRQWIAGTDGPGHGEDHGQSVAITSDGNVWACGDFVVPFEEVDVWIGRFDGGLP